MPILKLNLENVGPFDKLELDLTDGKGNAHLGPHILAGVNGSGKTTVLRAIAWCLSEQGSGFDREGWNRFLDHPKQPKAAIEFETTQGHSEKRIASSMPFASGASVDLGCIGTYCPFPSLARMEETGQGDVNEALSGWLSFRRERTNQQVQQFWVAALSKAALANAYGQSSENPNKAASTLTEAVKMILGADFSPSLNLQGPFPLPSLRFRGTDLNFSQLAAGFNATLSWVVDFLLRQEYFPWRDKEQGNLRPGLLLIDEIETHLHPQWQRRVLNGIRAAFPNTQIIVTTHSPFVISSCPDARLHMFKIDASGKAYLNESVDAPDSASLSANIMDVFDIKSEFGLPIEQKLNRWNDLKRRKSIGKTTPTEDAELDDLIQKLSAKGEELSSIVAEPPVLPESLIAELVSGANKAR